MANENNSLPDGSFPRRTFPDWSFPTATYSGASAAHNTFWPQGAMPNYTYPDDAFPSVGRVAFLVQSGTKYMYNTGVALGNQYRLVIEFYDD